MCKQCLLSTLLSPEKRRFKNLGAFVKVAKPILFSCITLTKRKEYIPRPTVVFSNPWQLETIQIVHKILKATQYELIVLYAVPLRLLSRHSFDLPETIRQSLWAIATTICSNTPNRCPSDKNCSRKIPAAP